MLIFIFIWKYYLQMINVKCNNVAFKYKESHANNDSYNKLIGYDVEGHKKVWAILIKH